MSKFRLIPITLFLFSFILRWSLISKGPYELDCLELALAAEQTLKTGQLQFMHAGGYPLAVMLGALFVAAAKLFSVSDPVIAVNFMSVVLSSLSVAILFYLTKKIFNEQTAIFTALSLSLSPLFLAQSLYGIALIPFIFFLFLGFNSLWNYTQRPLAKHFILTACYFGLMASTREVDTILILPAISYLYFTRSNSGEISLKKCWGLFFLLGTLIAAISLLFHVSFMGRSNASFWGQSHLYLNEYFLKNFMGIFSPRLVTSWKYLNDLLSPLGLYLSLAGLALAYKKNRDIFFLGILWIAVPLFFYGNLHSMLNPRPFIIFLPALLIMQSSLLVRWGELQTNRFLRFFPILIFITINLFLHAQIYPIFKFRHDHATIIEFARWIEQNTEPQAQIIVADERMLVEYYAHRQTFSRPMSVYGLSESQLSEFKQRLDAALDRNTPIYITTASLLAYNKNNQFFGLMEEFYDAELIGTHPYEDWHLGATTLQIFPVNLYKLSKK